MQPAVIPVYIENDTPQSWQIARSHEELDTFISKKLSALEAEEIVV